MWLLLYARFISFFIGGIIGIIVDAAMAFGMAEGTPAGLYPSCLAGSPLRDTRYLSLPPCCNKDMLLKGFTYDKTHRERGGVDMRGGLDMRSGLDVRAGGYERVRWGLREID